MVVAPGGSWAAAVLGAARAAAAEADRARSTETTWRPIFGFTRILLFMRVTVSVPYDGASMGIW
ncbi:hypothetical protein GCM10015535_67360 [Streptomyces gelaticus]|uniref:Secreted protein n=1 Tax=Streptomyces gelaticus TaxID=285446 RepID=A0ABQ2W8N0_9ACTN|nr:hypothetical protein GCM10015535_67360 [Streptomyces gelaticus]